MATERAPKRHRVWHAAFPRLGQFTLEHLLLLPLGVAIALLWANLAPESYFTFSYKSAFTINDIAMVIFFGLMMKEVVEANAPGGVLHSWRRVMLPLCAAIGATALPALLHIYLVEPLDEPMLGIAWPVTFATDLAVGYLAVRLIFKKAHPAIPFLILLAIASDGLGFIALAITTPAQDQHWVVGILIVAAAMAVAAVLRRFRWRSFWLYLLGPGVLAWFGFYWSGLHPALALVPIVPFFPHAARDPGFFVDASPDARDALSQFEVVWRYPAQIALFFFGLVNAGVPMTSLEEGTWALPIAVLVGKPIGIMIGAGIGVAAGLHLPHRLVWRDLIPIGLSAAIGLGVGLFFCAATIAPGQLRSEVSMGVLLTSLGLPLALIVARLMRVGRYERSAPGSHEHAAK